MIENQADLMTIEELSLRSGVTTRNIRAYQSRNLLPAPETLEGRRVSYYNREHLGRLRLISRLQERGFSLAGIADLLDALEAGKTLEQVLGMEAAVAETEQDDSRVVSAEELRELLPAELPVDDLLDTLRQMGLVIRDGNNYRVRHPAVLQMGREAHEAGIPFEVLLGEFLQVQEDAHRIAHRFVELYNNHIWLPYMAAGMPRDRLPEMIERMKGLRSLAVEIIEPMMSDAIVDEIDSIAQSNLPMPADIVTDTTRKKSGKA